MTTAFIPDVGSQGSVPSRNHELLRSPADVLAIEKVPLNQRITRWDFALNLLDGCRHDPQRVALHATNDCDLDGPVQTWNFCRTCAPKEWISGTSAASRP